MKPLLPSLLPSLLPLVLLLTTPLYGQSERPETIIVPVSSMGDVSEVRKQILHNTLTDELKKHFRIVPQEKYEQVLEQVFEELEYEECSEDTCIMRVQEMLQVENVFNLQIIGEGKDSQLNLKWITLDEKRNEEDYCEGCGTRDLRKMIGGLVEKLVGGKKVEPGPVVVVSRDDDEELRKQREEELRRKSEDELRKQKESEKRRLIEIELKKKRDEELKKNQEKIDEKNREIYLNKYFKKRKIVIQGGFCQSRIKIKRDDSSSSDNTTLEIKNIRYFGANFGVKYYLSEKLFVSGNFCQSSRGMNEIDITSGSSNLENVTTHSTSISGGSSNNYSLSSNYNWDYKLFSYHVGVGVSSYSFNLEYVDTLSKLEHKTNDNGIVSNILLGVDYIPTWNWLSSIDVYDLNFNLDIFVSFFPQKYLRITNDNYRYKYNRTEIYQFNIGYSF
jgi:hypothetical protein